MKSYTFVLGENLKRTVEIPDDDELGQYYWNGRYAFPLDETNGILFNADQIKYIVGPMEFEGRNRTED